MDRNCPESSDQEEKKKIWHISEILQKYGRVGSPWSSSGNQEFGVQESDV